jgi:hypothetical protein
MHRLTNLILLINLSVDLDAKVPLWYALLGGHESVIQALERGGATGLGL